MPRGRSWPPHWKPDCQNIMVSEPNHHKIAAFRHVAKKQISSIIKLPQKVTQDERRALGLLSSNESSTALETSVLVL